MDLNRYIITAIISQSFGPWSSQRILWQRGVLAKSEVLKLDLSEQQLFHILQRCLGLEWMCTYAII